MVTSVISLFINYIFVLPDGCQNGIRRDTKNGGYRAILGRATRRHEKAMGRLGSSGMLWEVE